MVSWHTLPRCFFSDRNTLPNHKTQQNRVVIDQHVGACTSPTNNKPTPIQVQVTIPRCGWFVSPAGRWRVLRVGCCRLGALPAGPPKMGVTTIVVECRCAKGAGSGGMLHDAVGHLHVVNNTVHSVPYLLQPNWLNISGPADFKCL